MEEEYYLTRSQLKTICDHNIFVALRYNDGSVMGVNCKVANILIKNGQVIDEKKTNFISYRSISFQEYISIKGTFFPIKIYG